MESWRFPFPSTIAFSSEYAGGGLRTVKAGGEDAAEQKRVPRGLEKKSKRRNLRSACRFLPSARFTFLILIGFVRVGIQPFVHLFQGFLLGDAVAFLYAPD